MVVLGSVIIRMMEKDAGGAGGAGEPPRRPEPEPLEDDYDDPDVKIILLGDSAVGKSKLIERYLMNDYNPRQLSTYALTIFRKEIHLDGDPKETLVGKCYSQCMSFCMDFNFLALCLLFGLHHYLACCHVLTHSLSSDTPLDRSQIFGTLRGKKHSIACTRHTITGLTAASYNSMLLGKLPTSI